MMKPGAISRTEKRARVPFTILSLPILVSPLAFAVVTLNDFFSSLYFTG